MALSAQVVNVLRFSALGSGLLYGFWRQRSLTSQAKIDEAQAAYHRKELLIQQAKAEWAKTHAPKVPKSEPGALITDPDDARFDLEKFLLHIAGEDKSSA